MAGKKKTQAVFTKCMTTQEELKDKQYKLTRKRFYQVFRNV